MAVTPPTSRTPASSLFLGETEVGGPFPVTTTLANVLDDRSGTATVSVAVPEAVGDGVTEFTLIGDETGTEVPVRVMTEDGLPNPTVSGTSEPFAYGESGTVTVSVDPATATGDVELRDGDRP